MCTQLPEIHVGRFPVSKSFLLQGRRWWAPTQYTESADCLVGRSQVIQHYMGLFSYKRKYDCCSMWHRGSVCSPFFWDPRKWRFKGQHFSLDWHLKFFVFQSHRNNSWTSTWILRSYKITNRAKTNYCLSSEWNPTFHLSPTVGHEGFLCIISAFIFYLKSVFKQRENRLLQTKIGPVSLE